ncbi:MAG: hypothetical protein R2713_00530 [Ilumatobacteraceae bacterium]
MITPDGSTLIVAESMGRRLTALDRGADGRLSNRGWADLGRRLPDGIWPRRRGLCLVRQVRAANECVRVAEGGEVRQVVVTDRPAYAACSAVRRDGSVHAHLVEFAPRPVPRPSRRWWWPR